MFVAYMLGFIVAGGLLRIFLSKRCEAAFYVLLGILVIAGWNYHHGAQSEKVLMGWYGHVAANSAIIGFLLALTVMMIGRVHEYLRGSGTN